VAPIRSPLEDLHPRGAVELGVNPGHREVGAAGRGWA